MYYNVNAITTYYGVGVEDERDTHEEYNTRLLISHPKKESRSLFIR